MTANSRGITRLTETFTASAERVFDAWLSPEKMARWFLPDTGGHVARVEIDARVGGSIRVVTHRAGRAVEHTGEYPGNTASAPAFLHDRQFRIRQGGDGSRFSSNRAAPAAP